MSVFGIEFDLSCYVMDNGACDVLLGRPFIYQANRDSQCRINADGDLVEHITIHDPKDSGNTVSFDLYPEHQKAVTKDAVGVGSSNQSNNFVVSLAQSDSSMRTLYETGYSPKQQADLAENARVNNLTVNFQPYEVSTLYKPVGKKIHPVDKPSASGAIPEQNLSLLF